VRVPHADGPHAVLYVLYVSLAHCVAFYSDSRRICRVAPKNLCTSAAYLSTMHRPLRTAVAPHYWIKSCYICSPLRCEPHCCKCPRDSNIEVRRICYFNRPKQHDLKRTKNHSPTHGQRCSALARADAIDGCLCAECLVADRLLFVALCRDPLLRVAACRDPLLSLPRPAGRLEPVVATRGSRQQPPRSHTPRHSTTPWRVVAHSPHGGQTAFPKEEVPAPYFLLIPPHLSGNPFS